MIFNALNLWPEIGLANSLLPSKPTDESDNSDDFDPWGTMFGDIFYCHNLLEVGRQAKGAVKHPSVWRTALRRESCCSLPLE